MIQRALAAGVLLVARAAVRTEEFHLVLLRIAVQSSPTGAAHANGFHDSALHRMYSLQFHVHKSEMQKVAPTIHFCAAAPARPSGRVAKTGQRHSPRR